MNKALKNILERNSHRNLTDPIPSKDEMEQVYQAALRAPDHAWVRPSSFIQVSGEGLKKLSDIFVEVAEESFENLTDDILEKYKNAPFRAPLIVILVSTKKDHPKVPRIEQIISTGTAGQNIMLALNALGYGAIWRTGRFAFNEKISEKFGLSNKQTVIGYIYIGTPKYRIMKKFDGEITAAVNKWASSGNSKLSKKQCGLKNHIAFFYGT